MEAAIREPSQAEEDVAEHNEFLERVLRDALARIDEADMDVDSTTDGDEIPEDEAVQISLNYRNQR